MLAILKTLLGCDGPFDFCDGAIGKMTAYFGTVEDQGRDSLHVHFLVWLRGLTPNYIAKILALPDRKGVCVG